ncbi:MAG: bifunctional 2-C-methyl-D-erythritol 4-phosphate cytidylyltransferase/2-C-methyl-D-erythritol 2,4-cyclodiphosphate synthase [Rickettsiales bacterium]|nr:bifunctional 2-C-methyl-D-erythritol 4-phosphate cytidylyltransferase/2-C-methyl-D-erythritol 2,4-cyclodiphosphate synthase [Rickettsiales bacterium]
MGEETVALIVAAGKSERMGGQIPKPYLQLGNEPILRRVIKIFQSHPQIDGVRVVIRREDHPRYRELTQGLTLFPCVIGGATRQDSVRLGLESLGHRNVKRVLVHDAARPFVTHSLISRMIDAANTHQAAVPGVAVVDTLKRASNHIVSETVERDGLYAIQTPQAFDYAALLAAHQTQAGQALTDDAAVMEKAGHNVHIIAGDPHNTKITSPQDLEALRMLLSLETETRVGHGYDVHQLRPKDDEYPHQHITLCGINIPFSHYLHGHSDADVGLHALVDAMLGAIGAGDIGLHFPPDDPKWQGAASDRFVLHAYELIKNRGGEVVHLDLTLICEKPKIAPYREQMVNHIAQILKLPTDRVSVKATTTEKLGFTGRGEGIAAQAVATVRLPKGPQ